MKWLWWALVLGYIFKAGHRQGYVDGRMDELLAQMRERL